MVKAKLRLGIFFICGIGIATIFIFYQLSILKRGESEDSEESAASLAKWKESFSWVSLENDEEGRSVSSSPRPRRTTCRHTIQGSFLVADDQGYICHRKSMLNSGCCDSNATGSYIYACFTCLLDSGCCGGYEACVSCCMSPDKKTFLMSVLNEARSLSNLLILSVSDQYELCLAKCRTSSRSVHHENTYKNPDYKFCYKRIPNNKEGGGGSKPPSS